MAARRSLPPEKILPETIDSIDVATATLADVDEQLSSLDWNSRNKEPELQERRRQLCQRIDVLRASAVPAVEGAVVFPEAEEKPFPLHAILITGNHRDRTHEADTVRMSVGFKNGLPLIQAIGVRMRNGGTTGELIWGSRRVDAARLAGWTEIRAKIYPGTLTDAQVKMLRSIENIQRAELSASERALAIAQEVEEYSLANDPATVEMVRKMGGPIEFVAAMLGLQPENIRDQLYINRLTPDVRRMLSEGLLLVGHARELAKIADPEQQLYLARDVARKPDGTGGRDVTYCRNRVNENLRSLRGVPWRLDVIVEGKDDRLIKDKCERCPHNSRSEPLLFENDKPAMDEMADPKHAGTCLFPPCFIARTEICGKLLEKTAAAVVMQAEKKDLEISKELVRERAADTPLRIETVQRKAKAMAEPPARSAPARSDEESGGKRKNPVAAAREEYSDKVDAWSRKSVEKITTAIIKSGPAYVIAANLIDLAIGDVCRPWDHPGKDEAEYHKSLNARRLIANQSRTKSLIAAMAEPGKLGTGLDAIAKAIPKDRLNDLLFNAEIVSWLPELIVLLAEKLGVPLDPPPDRDAMIAAAEGNTAAAATPAKPAKAPKKKAAKR